MVNETHCRICGGQLESVLDLGDIYPSSFLNEDEKLSEDMKAPLILAECKDCGLVQLKHTIDLDSIYKKQYWYSSALNKSMVSSLKDIVDEIENRIDLKDNDMIIDIGANDGTLLDLYSNKNLWTVAFEPAQNVKPKEGSVLVWIPDYFSKSVFDIYHRHPVHIEWIDKKAKVITAIAMFYDLPDPNKFVEDVKQILDDKGIFVIQFTDLMSMFKTTAFDNICHEHLEYYKLSDIIKLLRNHGLDIIDVSYNDVNGGSIRITACHDGAYLPSPSVVSSLTMEKEYFMDRDFGFFYDNIVNCLLQTKAFFIECKEKYKTVFLLGASTKGNTLLQVLGLTNKQIMCAAEVNKEKFGLRTGGSNIKIIPEDEAFNRNPDFFFVPIWHFKKSILQNERVKNYLRNGGILVFPLPYFHVVIDKERLNNERS